MESNKFFHIILLFLALKFCLDVLEFCHSVPWQHYYAVWLCHNVTTFNGYVLCFHHDVLRSQFFSRAVLIIA